MKKTTWTIEVPLSDDGTLGTLTRAQVAAVEKMATKAGKPVQFITASLLELFAKNRLRVDGPGR